MIDQREIEYLIAISEEKSISAAAKKLFITQPALSKFVAGIEKQLGTALFIRETDGVYLTHEGEIYLDACCRVRSIYTSARKQISELQNSKSGKIILGISSRTSSFIIPSVLDLFHKEYPAVEISLTEVNMPELDHLVATGAVDLALTYHKTNPNLTYRFLGNDPIYLVAPPSFYQKGENWSYGFQKEKLVPQAIADRPVIVFKKGRGMRAIVDLFYEENQMIPPIFLETNSIHLAYDLVQTDKAFSFVPGIAVRYLHDMKPGAYYQFRDYPMERQFYVCFRKDQHISASMQFLIDTIRKMQFRS